VLSCTTTDCHEWLRLWTVLKHEMHYRCILFPSYHDPHESEIGSHGRNITLFSRYVCESKSSEGILTHHGVGKHVPDDDMVLLTPQRMLSKLGQEESKTLVWHERSSSGLATRICSWLYSSHHGWIRSYNSLLNNIFIMYLNPFQSNTIIFPLSHF
jgi:hypothetical protein